MNQETTQSSNGPTREQAQAPVGSTRDEKAELYALLRMVSTLGLTVCAGIVIFFFLGLHLDQKYNLKGAGIAGGTLFGIGVAFFFAYRSLAKYFERLQPDTRERDTGSHE